MSSYTYLTDYINCTSSTSKSYCSSLCCMRVNGSVYNFTTFCATSSSGCLGTSNSSYTQTYSPCTTDSQNNTCAEQCCKDSSLLVGNKICTKGYFCEGYFPQEITQRIDSQQAKDIKNVMNGGLSVDAILALAITLAIIAIMLIIILCIWRRQKQVLANIEEIRSRRQVRPVDNTMAQLGGL